MHEYPGRVVSSLPGYRPGSGESKEINDEDVRKAFEAKPQLSRPTSVAFYTFDSHRNDSIEAMLRQVPSVNGVLRLSSALTTRQRRLEVSPWPQELPVFPGVERLRLLAAEAQTDALVILDHDCRVEQTGALWWGDRRSVSSLDVYVIDTRNGYLHDHFTATEVLRFPEGDFPEQLRHFRKQWAGLLASAHGRLALLLQGSASLVAPLSRQGLPLPPEETFGACMVR